MKPIARLTAVLTIVSLSLVPLAHAGAAKTPTAKTCFFVRNHLPCPCPKARDAQAVVHAARITASALGNAIGTTAAALSRAERGPVTNATAATPSKQ